MTAYGTIRIKTAAIDGVITHAQPEYEDCHTRALEHRVPLKQVIDAALQAWNDRSHDPEAVTNIRKATVNE